MSTNRDRIKSRITKLLGLAADNAAAEGEIENAMRFAAKLMLEHNIERAELAQEGAAAKEEFDIGSVWTTAYTTSAWELALCQLIYQAVGTVQGYGSGGFYPKTESGMVLFRDGKPITTKRQLRSFYGPAADVAVAVEMFNVLRQTIATMAVARHGSCIRGEGREYALGFVCGMRSTLQKQENEAPARTRDLVLRSTALVKEESAAWLGEAHGVRLTTNTSSRYAGTDTTSRAYQTGHTDGRKHGIQRGGAKRVEQQKRLT